MRSTSSSSAAGWSAAGSALDAATRGLTVGARRGARLGERHVEPVQQADPRRAALPGELDFGLVREALHERGLLLDRLAPHLVQPVPFLYPLHTRWERAYVGAGVALYDAMAITPARPAGCHVTGT